MATQRIVLAGLLLLLWSGATACSVPKEDPKVTATRNATLKKGLDENFCPAQFPDMRASWCANLTGLNISGRKVEVTTTLAAKPANGPAAQGICNAIASFAFGKGSSLGIEHIQVTGSGGMLLVSRRGGDDVCTVR